MQQHENAFVTLTYDNGNLPLRVGASGATVATLIPRHMQLFLKRLRKEIAPLRIRYFGVGEYGDESFRPHYHLAIFNFSNCARGETRKSFSKQCLWKGCCSQCDMVGRIWGKGDIEIRELVASKCEYLARYTVKKMTKEDDGRLDGRFPEFSRQSRKPGIGYAAVAAMAKELGPHASDMIDVPLTLKQGRKLLPLGRYMRNHLRKQLGREEGAPEDVLRQTWKERVQPVLEMAKKTDEAWSVRSAFAKANKGYEDRLRAKMEIRGKGKI